MSLKSLDDRVEAIRANAIRHQTTLRSTVSNIRANQHLSNEGQKVLIQHELQVTKDKVAQLRAEEERIIATRVSDLERKLTGTIGNDPSALIAYRDAQDRADRINTPGEAARMLSRATQTNDKTLALAIARRAGDEGWHQVTESFRATNPSLGEAMDDLVLLNKFRTDIGPRMETELVYTVDHD